MEDCAETTKRTRRASHVIRNRKGREIALRISPTEAIRLMCAECLGWEIAPKDCTSPLCPLFPFRGEHLIHLRGINYSKGREPRA